MPLLKPKPPQQLLRGLERNFAAVEAAFADREIPRDFRKEVQRFARRNNWRRRLYLQAFGIIRASTLRNWLNGIERAIPDMEEQTEREIEDARLRKRCMAALEMLENACGKLEESLPLELRPEYAG